MYIKKVIIENYRCFKEKTTIDFNNGLNVLVGENDSGKSAIIDAIKLVLGTTDQNWQRVNNTDYNDENTSLPICISIWFAGLTIDECASFMECLTINDGEYLLIVNYEASYSTTIKPNRTITKLSCGMSKDVAAPAPESKELLRTTYLRPLRDAASQMRSGKNSRLSQIISSIEHLNEGDDYVVGGDISTLSLSGIFDLSNDLLKNNSKIKEINDKVNSIMSSNMLLTGERIQTDISVSNTDSVESKKVYSLLEKLDLTVVSHKGNIGLGTSNLMSMACELLLNKQNDNYSSFMLIEEPEAHIHAQRQLKLIKSIQEICESSDSHNQVIMTTHSPLLASVVLLKNISLIHNKRAFSLAPENTKLNDEDYKYLEKYLDSTKANLFFAKGVLIVEGPAETLLLPTIAKILNRDFTDNGVSIVDVRGTGLSRYAKIFQRNDTATIPVPIACVTDRDIMPDCAPKICIDEHYDVVEHFPEKSKRKWRTVSEIEDIDAYVNSIDSRASGQNVKTFISDHWTLEYDLAMSGLGEDMVEIISKLINKEFEDIINELNNYNTDEEKASFIYSFFRKKLVSKADFAQQFAVYLENKYMQNAQAFINKLPTYIKEAIIYVTTPIG